MVLAVFRFTFGRPKVNRGVRGRAAPDSPFAPEGETPPPRGVGAVSPRKLPNRMEVIREKDFSHTPAQKIKIPPPAEPAKQEQIQ